MLTAHTPGVVVVGLIVVVHIAIVEVHVPRVGRIVCVRRRRPIVGRLDVLSAHLSQFTKEPGPFTNQPHRSPIPTDGVRPSCPRMPHD